MEFPKKLVCKIRFDNKMMTRYEPNFIGGTTQSTLYYNNNGRRL